MLITLYKIGGVLFRLLATNGFRVKAKKERFTAASSRCRQNLKYENFPSSFGRLPQNIAPKSVLHVHHDYFSSFNQSNHWFVALSLTLPSSDLKLPNLTTATSTTSPQINDLIGWMKKHNRTARAARFLMQCFDAVCKTTTWNFHIWGSQDNASSQQ